MINPRLKSQDYKHWYNYGEVREVIKSFRNRDGGAKKKESKKDSKIREETEKKMTAFEKELEITPGPIKDHMPYWYLACLERLKAKLDSDEDNSIRGATEEEVSRKRCRGSLGWDFGLAKS